MYIGYKDLVVRKVGQCMNVTPDLGPLPSSGNAPPSGGDGSETSGGASTIESAVKTTFSGHYSHINS